MPTPEEVLAIMQGAKGKKVVEAEAAGNHTPPSSEVLVLEELKKQTALLSELRRILIGEGVS